MKTVTIIDPTNQYDHLDDDTIRQMTGLIPNFLMQSTDVPAKEAFETCYQFGVYEIEGAIIDEYGYMAYPGDPPLTPLIKLTRGEEVIYVYPYAMVSIVQKDGSSFVTRMD